MTRKELARFSVALLLGMAIALPLGLWLGGRSDEPGRPIAMPSDTIGFRQPYSPVVLRDPHFLAAQCKGIEALERRCRETGEFCLEAREGRRWLAEHAGN